MANRLDEMIQGSPRKPSDDIIFGPAASPEEREKFAEMLRSVCQSSAAETPKAQDALAQYVTPARRLLPSTQTDVKRSGK